MQEKHIARVSSELSLKPGQVNTVAALLGEGATVPFIARYRKEATGLLDEVAIIAIRDRLEQLAELDKRRESILKSLEERELLTDELKGKVDAADTLAVLEDIYLPFRPKRRTRATIAREKGLEPLARRLFDQEAFEVVAAAESFVDPEKEVDSVDAALAGARDIIAEWVSEDAEARSKLRVLFETKGVIRTRVIPGKEEEGAKFRDYFEWEEPLCKTPSHRLLAMRRGEREKVLSLRVQPPEEEALDILKQQFMKAANAASAQVDLAIQDSYKRLLGVSMETEARLLAKNRADEEAIQVFARNMRQLLLSPPLGRKNVMAVDPGFRTGCKVVCLDRQGKLLHHDVIYPHTGQGQARQAATKVAELCSRFQVEALAVGNGTAGRETETFLREMGLPAGVVVVMVNESGASIYSASEVARREFPDQDVTVRGSVSIGRRLQDPLAELVKIDPKSIGVGQYQHDVDQPALKRSLDDVVASCVNGVGVEVNTASAQLLTYVSGLGPVLAKNIVSHRDEHGAFPSRKHLLKVQRLGAKAFEQAAGFLRVRDGDHPLDASAVHPESYPVVEQMARDLGCDVIDLMQQEPLRGKIQLEKYVTESVGMPTLQDIMQELAKPGRDPRERFELFQFAEGVEKIEDLEAGMKLPGIITNITKFGAFVDIGVHQDGLVHISQMADRFIKDPNEVVQLQQKVTVTVLEVDLPRKRISLSMRESPGKQAARGNPEARGKPGPRSRPEFRGKPAPRREERRKQEELDPNNPFVRALRNAKVKQ